MAKKPSWLYRQSGVIPWRAKNGDIEILLITSVRRGRWIIPKGVVERHMTPAESAQKEAWEEAGVTGVVSEDAVGSYEYEKWGGTCTVGVFLLRVEDVADDWPERKVRKRRWLPISEAAEKVEETEVGAIIRLAEPLIMRMNGKRT